MAPGRYAEFLPAFLDWMRQMLDGHAGEKRSVASFNFPRLPDYFSEQTLNSASVVITRNLPRPPLSSWGLSEFASFETQAMAGITFDDTYFVQPDVADDESIHCHELVHLIQWEVLGPKDFLLLYASGLQEHGYLNSPVEVTAYEHQRRFDAHRPPYSVDAEVRRQTLALLE
jgi:hypothetical protein